MNFKNPFSKKAKDASGIARTQARTDSHVVSVDDLEACVGGRSNTEGVDCYMQSEQSRSH